MKIRISEGGGDSTTATTHEVKAGQSLVFLTPSVLNPVLCVRFYDVHDALHQVPASSVLSIDPSEASDEVAALRSDVASLRTQLGTTGMRLGPRQETQEDIDRRTKQLMDAVEKAQPPPVDRSAQCTTNGKPVADVRASQTNETGQHDGYIVLCEDERKKGFVRPYRDAYKHRTCGTVTTMGRSLSETYARDPGFYGATFCVSCNKHLPVAEFVWTADGQQVGS